jgi:hypothetical protein
VCVLPVCLELIERGGGRTFAVSAKGLGQVCFKKDRLFVTAFESHEVYEVRLDGTVRRI